MLLAETLARTRTVRNVPSSPSSLVEDRFHQLPHVVSARAGDATVLMDRKRGTYFTLNEVGGRVWELVGAGSTNPEIVKRLLEEYDVSREQLEGDLAATLRQLVSDRLIAPGAVSIAPPGVEQEPKGRIEPVSPGGELRVPSVLRCGLVILAVKAMLKTRGFERTIKWVRRQVNRVPVRTHVDVEALKATEYRVAMAGALYPGRALCLERSICLWYCLRRSGIPAELRLGIQPYPFLAHTWVECEGEVINDVPEHVKHFIPFAGLNL